MGPGVRAVPHTRSAVGNHVVAFFFLGQWLDREWETSPWLMLAGLAIGILGGLIRFFKTAMEIGKKSEHNGKQGDTEA